MKISALSLVALAAVPETILGLSGPALSGCISTFARPSALFSTKLDQPIRMPSVTRANVKRTSIEPHPTYTDDLRLPLGVRLTGGEKLRAEGLTGKGVRVAVIDSGVYANHPGFKGQVTQQRWYRDGEWHCEGPEHYHGTHVAGTIHMLAPDAEIYNYCVFETKTAESSAIEEAIMQAIDDGCQIINMSLGDTRRNDDIADAIDVAHEKGVVMIVSAGNDGDNSTLTYELSYPAMNIKTISVAAVDKKKGLPTADFSNTNDAVDYAGIGVDVISFHSKTNGYRSMNGTSMATPHVCGFVTALMTKDGKYSDSIKDDKSLRTLLDKNFVRDIGEKGRNNSTGCGFLTYLNETEFQESWPSGRSATYIKNLSSTEYIMRAIFITSLIGINLITAF